MVFLSLLVYTLVSFVIGGFFLYAAIVPVDYNLVCAAYDVFYSDWSIRTFAAALGALILLFWLRFVIGKRDEAAREKTIAFNTGNGEISISLMAMEDMLKKQIASFRQLKEVRPHILVYKKRNKKEIHVILKVVIDYCSNLPELTSSIQASVRSRVQDFLAIEENISVDIKIRKIHFTQVMEQKRQSRKDDDEVELSPAAFPYRDYQADI